MPVVQPPLQDRPLESGHRHLFSYDVAVEAGVADVAHEDGTHQPVAGRIEDQFAIGFAAGPAMVA